MSDEILENLYKASDRIKSGIHTKRHDEKMSNKDMHNALSSLMNDPKIPDSIKEKLKPAHKSFGEQAERDEAMRARTAFKAKEFVPGKASEEKAAKEAKEKEQYDAYMKENAPTKVKELGGAAQYKQDVENPKMRSKAAEGTSSGVKDKLMGENVAIRDKSYGRALDTQARLKHKADKIMEAKGPSEVIRVSAAPTIPDEHKNDAILTNMMKLRHTLTDSTHVKAVDDEINKRVAHLSGNMNKSLFKNNDQWKI